MPGRDPTLLLSITIWSEQSDQLVWRANGSFAETYCDLAVDDQITVALEDPALMGSGRYASQG
jgi:hypothetical protein